MNLTSLEILKIIITKFKNENIYYFSKKELEKQLNYFAKNKKYETIFNENIDIIETIDIFLMCGYLYSVNTNQDTIYIIKTDESINYNKLLEEALDTYCGIRKICEKYSNLKFYLHSSDDMYTLVNGQIGNHNIEWSLITDGTINSRNIKLVKGTKHQYNSPFINKKIIFDDSSFDIVNVNDSTYVLRQQILDGRITDSLLYTDSSNYEKINEIAKVYCKSR